MKRKSKTATLDENIFLKTEVDSYTQRYALLEEACGVGLWEAMLKEGDSLHPDSKWTWSSEMRRLLGFESEVDFPNVVASWSDRLHPDDAPEVFEAFSEHLADRTGKTRYDKIYRMKVKNGTYRWFRGAGGCLHQPDGETILACGSLVDVHEMISLQQLAAQEAAADTAAIHALTDALSALANGDLTYRISATLSDKTKILKTDFNLASENLQQIFSSVVDAIQSVRNGSFLIDQSTRDLSSRTETQAASIEETASALDELTMTVKNTAVSSQQVATITQNARDEAKKSDALVQETVSAMSNIEQSSRQINQIIGVIDDIAFQTNLLALNAAVEAARAGENGRSFGVVAQEVRALAQRSATAAKEIKAQISISSKQVEHGVDLVARTGETISNITSRFVEIASLVNEIASSTNEQSIGLATINTAIGQIDQLTQQNTAMVVTCSH